MVGAMAMPEVAPEKKLDRMSELESSIKFDITKVSENKKAIKEAQKKLKIGLEADPAYRQILDEMKEKQKEKREARKRIIDGNAELLQIDNGIKSMRLDSKMRQMSLSDYMIEYEGLTGQLTLPGMEADIEFEKVIRIKGSV